jgi:exonuclease VII small subunit
LEQYWAGRDRQNRADAGVSDLEEAVEQFDAAETSFDSAQSSFERGRMSAEDAEGVLEGITPEVVNASDNLSHVDAVQELKGTISVLEELEVFAGGAGDGCRGVTHVSEGFIAYMGKNWEESKSEFQTAKSSFDAAVESLDTVSFDRVSFLLTFFSEMLCEIGEGPEASEHWISASETAHEGDQETAGEEINEGWRLMAECHGS